MKLFNFLLLAAFAFICPASAPGENYILSKDYEVTIHGTSNHDDWDETVGKVTGTGVMNFNTDGSFDLDALQIKINVNSIKSKNPIMDNKTYSALKADANPEIIFTLNTPLKSIKASLTGTFITAKGKLTIAGVNKSVIMQVKVSVLEKNKLLFQGSQIIKETDYGISPPSALFGALKTGDDITLNFKTYFVVNN
jgi:polyisoprenoid-binding protein YceI